MKNSHIVISPSTLVPNLSNIKYQASSNNNDRQIYQPYMFRKPIRTPRKHTEEIYWRNFAPRYSRLPLQGSFASPLSIHAEEIFQASYRLPTTSLPTSNEDQSNPGIQETTVRRGDHDGG